MTIGSRLRKANGTLDARTPAIWISNGTGRDGRERRESGQGGVRRGVGQGTPWSGPVSGGRVGPTRCPCRRFPFGMCRPAERPTCVSCGFRDPGPAPCPPVA
ncbi:hypothetical protein DMH25_44120 [Streptomyces sp. WAC 01325]|nr:hypothetical protein DMH25_44120 [Streptomyces sp. WAC 01325]